MKQSRAVLEYERLQGVRHGGDRKSSGHFVRLKQEDTAKQLGVKVIGHNMRYDVRFKACSKKHVIPHGKA